MAHFEGAYSDLLNKVINTGFGKKDRTGAGTFSRFAESITIDPSNGFPIVTGRKMFFNSMLQEALWLLSGETNIQQMVENGCNIWKPWADSRGDLGPVYGLQLRAFNSTGCDQWENIINLIHEEPTSRRIVATMWNPLQLKDMALPPCHHTWEIVMERDKLNLKVDMRSCDLFVGLPYDIGLYAIIQRILCSLTGTIPGLIYISIADAHVYKNHLKDVREYLTNERYELPYITCDFNANLMSQFKIKLHDYQHGPVMKPVINV